MTDPSRLARSVAEVDGDQRVGGESRARFCRRLGRHRARGGLRTSTVAAGYAQPGQVDATVIKARLFADADQTRLVIEERGLPLEELDEHGAGWQAHIEDLAAHLGGHAALDWRSRWIELIPAYRGLADRVA